MNKTSKHTDVQEHTEKRTSLNLFRHNSFVILFSVMAAIVTWFVVNINDVSPDTPTKIENVPIVIQYSDEAINGKLHVFDQTQKTADIYVKANSAVAKKLTADDFEVIASFSPVSGKTSGTSLQNATLTLRATKKNSLADYEVDAVYPEEISVQYDRKKEISLKITNNVQRTAATGFYADEISLSDETVTISGPESYVNQVKQAVIEKNFPDPLTATQEFTTPVLLYGQDGKPMNYSSMYMTLSADNVNVTINVLSKKTVKLTPVLINAPSGFSTDSRLEITPATVDIVGANEVLEGINEIALSGSIDFADITLENQTQMNISMPQGVKNISNVDTAQVVIHLGGYQSKTVTTKRIAMMNATTGQAEFVTQSLNVTVIGSEAQIAKITGDSMQATVDLSGQKDTAGNVDLPAKITFVDSMDTCWAVGEYPVTVFINGKKSNELAANMETSSEAAVAAPQE